MAITGKTILLTRPRSENRSLQAPLESLGARVVQIPMIEIVPPESWAPVDRAIRDLPRYDWVVFTSANAVDAFCDRIGAPFSNRVAAVGPRTARRLAARGLQADRVPDDFRAEGLLRTFGADLAGVRILLPRAAVAGEALPQVLESRGARVDVVSVYRTVRPRSGAAELGALLLDRRLDCIVFTSGSTAHNFLEMVEESGRRADLGGVAVAVIGPVTRDAARARGLEVDIEADAATPEALVQAIVRHFEGA